MITFKKYREDVYEVFQDGKKIGTVEKHSNRFAGVKRIFWYANTLIGKFEAYTLRDIKEKLT